MHIRKIFQTHLYINHAVLITITTLITTIKSSFLESICEWVYNWRGINLGYCCFLSWRLWEPSVDQLRIIEANLPRVLLAIVSGSAWPIYEYIDSCTVKYWIVTGYIVDLSPLMTTLKPRDQFRNTEMDGFN